MNRAEAKREAHGAIASLIDVQLSSMGDIFVGIEDYPENDFAKITTALHEIQDYHARLAARS